MHEVGAFIVRGEEGEALWALNTFTRVLARSGSTGGAMGAWEWWGTAAGNPPLHVHHGEDEAFFLLEGGVTFEVAAERIAASAGDLVFAPRGLPHRFAVTSAEARMLVLAVPGGFERFFSEVGRPAERRELPPPEEPDAAELARRAGSYRVEILGPPIQGSSEGQPEGNGS
jgi:quercetin dioxygenase-like cupin family protein